MIIRMIILTGQRGALGEAPSQSARFCVWCSAAFGGGAVLGYSCGTTLPLANRYTAGCATRAWAAEPGANEPTARRQGR